MVRFTGAEPVTAFGGCDPFRAFAHRLFCAKLIRRRADADKVRRSFDPELPKAASRSKALNVLLCSCQFFQMPYHSGQISLWFPPRQEIVMDRLWLAATGAEVSRFGERRG